MARPRNRLVYRVDFSRPLRSWVVRFNGRVIAVHETQAAAVREAVRSARIDRAERRMAQVVLRGKNGRIRWERTYGRDPARTRG